ncbi:hypothetical protein [Naumannella huperziae]
MRFDNGRPFTTAQWLAAGRRRTQLRGPAYQRLFHGCYVATGTVITPKLLARAALLVRPSAEFVTHHTAARLLGAIVPDTCETHVGAVAGARSRREAVVQHRYATRPATVRHDGVRMTSPTQTFLDLAARLDLVDLVVLGDSLVRRRGIDPARLVEAARDMGRGRGGVNARRAAALVRRGVDSPGETRLRLLLVLAGLPEPEINIELRDAHGAVRRRLDLGHRAERLALEYDGRHHIERERQWEDDITRREEIGADGWEFLIFVARDLSVTPAHTLQRVCAGMRRHGMRVPRLRTEWQRHFPGRG